MLINLRNALMSKVGALPRPVEYIESDGNQWFDVTIPSRGSNTGAYIDYMLTEYGAQNKGLFGSGTVNSSAQYDLKLILVNGGSQRFDRYDRSCGFFSPYVGQRQNFTFNPKGNPTSQPYRYYSSISGYIRQGDSWYTGSYAVTNATLGVFHAYNRADIAPVKMRLYGLELREYSSATAYTTTLKLTPVSVGGEGAMLDEITGETYFNMGTGDFGIGPDIPSPV